MRYGVSGSTTTSFATTTWNNPSKSSKACSWLNALKRSDSICIGSNRTLFSRKNPNREIVTYLPLPKGVPRTMIDMLNLLPQYKLGQFDSRHRLVIVAAQRAKHLIQGAKRSGLVRFTKEPTCALDEVLRGEVKYLVGEEAREAM